MDFYKKYIYSPAKKGIYASLNIASTGRFFRFFMFDSASRHRLPSNIILFIILFLDMIILSFAVYTVVLEVDKRLDKFWNYNIVKTPVEPANNSEKAVKKINSILLDDFNKVHKNRLGGSVTTQNGYGGFCTYSVIVLPEELQKVLEVSYDVSPPSSYCGYMTSLNGLDLSKYRVLSFQLKGETGDEVFKIELSDGESISSISISQILPKGLSEQWQKIFIPLSSFSSTKNWEKMEGNLAMLFENSQGMPYKGKIYIRGIRFLINPD